jgi:hypothetical protein
MKEKEDIVSKYLAQAEALRQQLTQQRLEAEAALFGPPNATESEG